MRITFLIDKMNPGGTQRHVVRLARGLQSRGESVEILCLGEAGAWGGELTGAGISVHELHTESLFSLRGITLIGRLVRCLRASKPEILHCLLFDANLFGPLAARLSGVGCRVIASRRDIGFWMNWTHGLALWLVSPLVDQHSANARAVARVRARTDHLREEKFIVIPNSVDPAPFRGGHSLRGELGLPEGERVFVCVARLRPEKGQATLVEALAILTNRGVKITVLLAGDGPERERLEAQARTSGVDDRLMVLGHYEGVADLYATADAAILPSQSEGFPNAALEAMAAGLPLLASAVGGVPELIEDGENGLLFSPGDPVRLAEAVERFAGLSPEARSAMIRKNRELVTGRYAPEVEVCAYLELYQKLLLKRTQS